MEEREGPWNPFVYWMRIGLHFSKLNSVLLFSAAAAVTVLHHSMRSDDLKCSALEYHIELLIYYFDSLYFVVLNTAAGTEIVLCCVAINVVQYSAPGVEDSNTTTSERLPLYIRRRR